MELRVRAGRDGPRLDGGPIASVANRYLAHLRPQYLHGRSAKIVAKDGDKWLVRLDEPVGRFTNADLRLQAIQLESLGGPE